MLFTIQDIAKKYKYLIFDMSKIINTDDESEDIPFDI